MRFILFFVIKALVILLFIPNELLRGYGRRGFFQGNMICLDKSAFKSGIRP